MGDGQSFRRRAVVSIAGALVLLLVPSATVRAAPRTPGRTGEIRVDDLGDEALAPGATTCDADPDPAVRRCSLRAALELLAARRVPGRISLPAGSIIRSTYRPYPVRADVVITGRGSTRTSIASSLLGSFLAPGANDRVRLEGMTVVSVSSVGLPPAADVPADLALRDVRLTSDASAAPGASSWECGRGSSRFDWYFTATTVTDPTALRAFPSGLIG